MAYENGEFSWKDLLSFAVAAQTNYDLSKNPHYEKLVKSHFLEPGVGVFTPLMAEAMVTAMLAVQQEREGATDS
ncbi:hypothetical protein FRAAL2737 [Frankia alni ACN14a]|uniref:Uncharacterized protein n=2 Tax=Frankiaceae TaxID=74712 RepID=Q0RM71_FRAAA|nr:hypothetical protein FRAAL2737 [Frankia alni ACN14a]